MSQPQHIIDDQLLAKYLSGEALPEEAMQVEQWLQASASNRAMFHKAMMIWNELSTHSPHQAPDSSALWKAIQTQQPVQSTAQTPVKKLWLLRIGIAASLLLVASLSAWLLITRENKQQPVAKIQMVYRDYNTVPRDSVLPDGSITVLQPNSSFKYPVQFNEERIVYLKGAAGFDVKPDALHPFIVQVGAVTIKVLGTRFDVKEEAMQVKVMVHSGRVRMYGGDDSLTLESRQYGTYDIATAKFLPLQDLSARSGAGTRHSFQFRNEPLGRIAEELQKAYGISIVFENKALMNCTLIASFEEQSLDYVLDIIAATLNIQYRTDNKTVYLVERVASRLLKCVSFCIILLLVARHTQAQHNPALRKAVQLAKNEWTLNELLTSITLQTAVKFSVNTKKFPPEKKLHTSRRNYTVYTLLEEIRHTTGVNYAEFGSHIIFADRIKPMRAATVSRRTVLSHRTAKSVTITGHPASSKQFAVTPSIVPIAAARKAVSDSFVLMHPFKAAISQPAVKPLPSVLNNLHSANMANTGSDRAARKQSRQALRAERRAEYGSGYTGLFAAAGAGIDDALYSQATLLAGHTWLYAIGSVASNFREGGIRYGLGSSYPLNHRWTIHAQWVTGGLDYKKDTLPSAPKTVNLRWNSARLLAAWKITGNVHLQFGPVLHMQHLKLDKSGTPVAIGLPEEEFYDSYKISRPPYTLSNSYQKHNSEFRVSWIGFQAGVFIHLNFSDRQ